MTDWANIVQKVLRADDTCRVAAEVKETTYGKNRPRCLALVNNKFAPDEWAIFIFKKRRGAWNIDYAVPVYCDIRVSFNEANFEFRYDAPSQIYNYEAPSVECAQNLVADIIKSSKSALRHNFHYGGDSHTWLKNYSEVLERNKSEIYDIDNLSTMVMQGLTSSSNDLLGTNPFLQQYDPSKFSDINSTWVTAQLKAREKEFTKAMNITIFLGTWNVNGKKPSESLDPWLRDPALQPDIYAIGFQELDLTAEALLLGDTTRAAPWEQQIMNTLSLQGDYVRIMSKQLVGILLCMYIKKEHFAHVSDIQSGLAAVGIMGMMGNKGGVAIRFNLYDSTICVVNSHLNAHFENVARRNQDMRDIARRIMFYGEHGSFYTIYDHDHLFWIGDLNYRIAMNDTEVKNKIKNKDWLSLFACDQLNQAMKTGAAFEGFTEPPLQFTPSYKYDIGTDTFDTSEKRRTPAWCDRVLFKTGKNVDSLQVLNYRRHELLSSDHRPVSGSFQLKIKSIVADKKAKVYQELVKELDKKENEFMPDATVSTNSVVFPDVKYLVPTTQSITIENTGQVVARFRFIPKLDERKFCKSWLWVSPPFGVMVPREKVTISLTVHIDNTTAPAFNKKSESLEDILILHLENGKDYFMTVSGNYLASSFGNSLDYLVRFPHPIRNSTPLPTTEQKMSVPKELWRIIDYIYKKGLREEGLFLQSGVQKEMDLIRECLDTGESFAHHNVSIHSVAETVIRFLESLSEPVIPYYLYNQVLEASGNYVQCKAIIAHLPIVNYNVFFYLVSFLREVLAAPENKITADKLAVVFSSVMLRADPAGPPQSSAETVIKKKADFIYHFLADKE